MRHLKQFLPLVLTSALTVSLVALAYIISTPVPAVVHAAPAKVTPTITKNMNAKYVDNVQAAKTAVPNKLVPLDGSGKFPLAVIPQGSGSGLDADKLDGKDSTAFSLTSHTHYGQSWTGTGQTGLSVSADSTHVAIQGTHGSASGTFTGAAAVWGDSKDGVGVTGTSNSSYGVTGVSFSGNGLEGSSVFGFALKSFGSTTQGRADNGLVKALALMSGGSITRCYNSQESKPNSTAPCDFTLGGSGGDYTINFGFQVNDRFVSVTPYWAGGSAVIPVVTFPSANVVEIQTYSSGTTKVDSAFFVTIY